MKKIFSLIILVYLFSVAFSQKHTTIEKYKEVAGYIRYDNMAEVKKYVNLGYLVSPPVDFKFSLLTVSVMYERYEIAQYLIDNGANPNFENGEGSDKTSVLGFALNLDNPYNAVKILLKNGANPNYQEASGLYMIEKSFNSKNNNVIKLLLNAGASANNITYIENIKYSSLGLLLSLHYDYTAVKLMIEAGANVNSKIFNSSKNIKISVLDFAEYINNNSGVVSLLKKSGAKNYYNANSSSSTKYASLNSIFSYIGATNTSNSNSNTISYSENDIQIPTITSFSLDKSNFCNGNCNRYIITFNKVVIGGGSSWELKKNQIYVYKKHNGEWHSSSSLIGSYISHDKSKVESWAKKKYSE